MIKEHPYNSYLKSIYSFGILICLISHLFSFYIFQNIYAKLAAPASWYLQFLFLLVVSLILSIYIRIPYFKNSRVIALAFRYILIYLLSYPMGAQLDILLLLSISYILDTHAYLDKFQAHILSWPTIFILIFYQLPHKRYDTHIGFASIYNVITVAFILLCFNLFCYIYIHCEELFREEKNRYTLLQTNIIKLTEANLDLQNYTTEAVKIATEDERKRISREIHDSIGYTLTNIVMLLEASLRMTPDNNKDFEELLLLACEQARDGLSDIRKTLYTLRQQEHNMPSGIHSIHQLTVLFSKITGINVINDYGNVPLSFGNQLDLFLYRLVQESLVNTFKHANATQISIYYHQNENGLYVTIKDNGTGNAHPKEGIGLKGIRERLATFNGELLLNNTTDGFSISVYIPRQKLKP